MSTSRYPLASALCAPLHALGVRLVRTSCDLRVRLAHLLSTLCVLARTSRALRVHLVYVVRTLRAPCLSLPGALCNGVCTSRVSYVP